MSAHKPLTRHEEDRIAKDLQALIRIDTTNPPGDEEHCAVQIADWLKEFGVESRLIKTAPKRKAVVARLKGDGSKPPLLMAGHMDVVPANPAEWTHPPFGGEIHEGCIWGRGAIDMKNFLAMSLGVLRHVSEKGVALKRDLIFCAVPDEEIACEFGSKYVVDHHADLVKAEYMLGEGGGFSQVMDGKWFYPIEAAEKGIAWMKMKATGRPGHGSMPHEDMAIYKLAEALKKIEKTRLPQHKVKTVGVFIDALSSHMAFPKNLALKALTTPGVSDLILENLMPDKKSASVFKVFLSNSVAPTALSGGSNANVIPSEVSVVLDGRTLPGQDAQSLIRELKAMLGNDLTFELMHELPPLEFDTHNDVFRTLTKCVKDHHHGAVPTAYMAPGYTDAKYFSRLGAICYGFAPVMLDPQRGLNYGEMFHGIDERIPVDGLAWGSQVLTDAVLRIAG